MKKTVLKANYIRDLKLEATAYADQTKAYPVIMVMEILLKLELIVEGLLMRIRM